jgi:hypothetical protein
MISADKTPRLFDKRDHLSALLWLQGPPRVIERSLQLV